MCRNAFRVVGSFRSSPRRRAGNQMRFAPDSAGRHNSGRGRDGGPPGRCLRLSSQPQAPSQPQSSGLGIVGLRRRHMREKSPARTVSGAEYLLPGREILEPSAGCCTLPLACIWAGDDRRVLLVNPILLRLLVEMCFEEVFEVLADTIEWLGGTCRDRHDDSTLDRCDRHRCERMRERVVHA